MNQVLGWRWAFLIQASFLLLGIILVFFFVRIPRKVSEVPPLRLVDWSGFITLMLSLALLLVGVNAGENLVPWSDPLVYPLFHYLSLGSLPLFLSINTLGDRAYSTFKTVANRNFSASCLTFFLHT